MTTTSQDHWAEHARRWQHVKPPLRPCSEDRAIVTALLTDLFPEGRPLRVLLLGVTPELATLDLPRGSSLVAVEKNEAMIRHVWQPGVGREVLRGTWQKLPLTDASVDVALGDGCFTTLPSPDDYQLVGAELRRVLRPGGVFLHRFFLRPAHSESPETIFDDLLATRIPSVEIFKWRLAMALVDPLTATVRLADIWQAIEARLGAHLQAFVRTGFPLESIRTLEHYKGVEKRYSFPTVDDLRNWLNPHFAPGQMVVPEYELGKCCVHVVSTTAPR